MASDRKPMVNSLAEWRGLHLRGQPAKIATDAEVRAYVDELLETNTFQDVAAACRARFGSERTPSKSAIHRYWLTYLALARRPIAPARIAPKRRSRGRSST